MSGNVAHLPNQSPCPARLNPLAVTRTDNLLFRFPNSNWESHLGRLVEVGFRGTICGPHGSGKTTLLDQLQPRLLGLGRHSWRTRPPLSHREQLQLIASCLNQPSGTVLLVDSAEQLSRWNWWRLVRQSAERNQGLIATVHRPSRLLPTWFRTETSPELFWELFQELVPGDAEAWRAPALESYRRHRGNIREAFRELYDQFWCADRR